MLLALRVGNKDLVPLLIERGADINIQSKDVRVNICNNLRSHEYGNYNILYDALKMPSQTTYVFTVLFMLYSDHAREILR